MANDITILSCPQCGFPKIRDCGNGLYQCDDCGTHFDKSENIVLTNEEYLKSCTTEQLADVFMRFMFDAKFKRKFVYGNFYDEFAKWLKQPHKKVTELIYENVVMMWQKPMMK